VAASAVKRESDGVPQAPEPKTKMRLMRVFWLRSGFRAGEQAADVLVVLENDEQRHGGLHGDEKRWPVAAHQNQAKTGKLPAPRMEATEHSGKRQNDGKHGDGGSAAHGAATRKTPNPWPRLCRRET